MSRFKGLQDNLAKAAPAAESSTATRQPAAKSREGKKAIVGYFSENMSRQLRLMAIEENTTVQGLVGEALDLLMRARGKHPFGER
jgi:hypothetical protein